MQKHLNSLKRFLRTTAANSQNYTANITEDDIILLQHIAKMSLCCEVCCAVT